MANNIFGGGPNAAIAKVTALFTDMGLASSNTSIVYLVSPTALKSWIPDRSINAIAGITQGQGYYFVAKQDMDLSAYFIPPADGSSGSGYRITSQPASATIQQGGSNTFYVAIAGQTGTAHFQWTKDGVDISGATGGSYTTGLAGIYRVKITDDNATLTSDPATLTVQQMATIYYSIGTDAPTSNADIQAWPSMQVVHDADFTINWPTNNNPAKYRMAQPTTEAAKTITNDGLNNEPIGPNQTFLNGITVGSYTVYSALNDTQLTNTTFKKY